MDRKNSKMVNRDVIRIVAAVNAYLVELKNQLKIFSCEHNLTNERSFAKYYFLILTEF